MCAEPAAITPLSTDCAYNYRFSYEFVDQLRDRTCHLVRGVYPLIVEGIYFCIKQGSRLARVHQHRVARCCCLWSLLRSMPENKSKSLLNSQSWRNTSQSIATAICNVSNTAYRYMQAVEEKQLRSDGCDLDKRDLLAVACT